jgi:hypothetical protein
MPIQPFLANQAFEPEVIRAMSHALEGACEALGLRLRDDPATRMVIEFAQRGVRDPDTLRDMVLKEFARGT